MKESFYSTDITISINEIKASSQKEADALISEFIAKISTTMQDKIRWDEADWQIQTNIFNADKGVWITTTDEDEE